MKKLIVLLIAVLPMLGMAQESPLNKIFDKYSGQEGYTSVYITSYMFDLFAKVAQEEAADFEHVTKGLEAIKILTVSSDLSAEKRASFYHEIKNALPPSVYKDFMIVKEGAQEITFKVKDEGNKISEFVMIVKDKHEPVILFLQGDIDLANLSKMSKSMDIKGFEHLEKVEDEH
jgi:hypothetical protein